MRTTRRTLIRRSGLTITMLMVAAAVLSAQSDPSGLRIVSSSTTTQLSQYEITWTFSEPVEYGTYVNGDYWVVGPVEIVEITPPYDGQNGTMINPLSGSGQGYDSTSRNFRADLVVEAPVTVPAGSSVVTAISEPAGSRPALKTAAVLTVISQPPPLGSFRPPLIGTDKTHYWQWSTVEANMPRLPTEAAVPSAPDDLDNYIRNSQRPWILHGGNWVGRYFHPVDNMPGSYHREIGRYIQEAAVLLMMELPGREMLLRNFIQVGIDYYGMAVSGQGTSAYWAWPVIFAGLMLQDPQLHDLYIDNRDEHMEEGDGPREYFMIYDVAAERQSSVQSSVVDSGVTWTGKGAAWRQSTNNSNCYEQEHLHPSEWDNVSASEGCSQPLSTREAYRRINSPGWVGQALAASMMSAQEKYLRSELFFAYVERWMEEDLSDPSHDAYMNYTNDASEYGSSMSSFVDEFWNAHYD